MRHFIVLLVLALVAYAGWQLGARMGRGGDGMQRFARHGIRLLAIVLILVILWASAWYIPSLQLLGNK